MTQLKFNRSYELIFGTPFELGPSSFSIFTDPQQRLSEIENLVQNVPNAVRLTEHNISFHIKKTKQSTTNKSYITVYNMSEETFEYLSNTQGRKIAVILSAGYGGNNKEIFRGQLESYKDHKEGPDRVTKLFLTDGAENSREATTVRSYRKGTPVNRIITELFDDLGVPRAGGGVLLDPDNVVTRKALYFSGRTTEALSRMAAGRLSQLADWTITDMHAYWVPDDQSLPPEQVIPVSEETGLIGSIVVKDDTSGKTTYSTTSNDSSRKNIEFKIFLDGAIIPLKAVNVESGNFDGQFKIQEVEHKGMLEGNDWFTKIVAEEVPDTDG